MQPPIGTVKSRVRQGLIKLREALRLAFDQRTGLPPPIGYFPEMCLCYTGDRDAGTVGLRAAATPPAEAGERIMVEDERRQRIVERIQEDERLRGDLEDEAAKALLSWASARAAAAADPSRPDAAVEADVQAVRAATRAAARAGESDPRRLIAVAEAELSRSRALDSAAARPPGRALDPSAGAPPAEEPSAERTASQASPSRSGSDSRRKRQRLNTYLKRASRNR